jgi:hypothetical protein
VPYELAQFEIGPTLGDRKGRPYALSLTLTPGRDPEWAGSTGRLSPLPSRERKYLVKESKGEQALPSNGDSPLFGTLNGPRQINVSVIYL